MKSTEAVIIDEMEGYQSLAEAEHAKTGAPVIVFQVILFVTSICLSLKQCLEV